MDIYEYLKRDHQQIAELFELFKTATTDKNKLEIFQRIKQELTIHADSEANTFYKLLEFYQTSEDEALHGEEEHNEIKEKLSQIAKHEKVNSDMHKEVLELKKLVEHHVSDEEGKIFRAAKKVLSEEEAYIIKEKMHAYKEKLLNSPAFADKAELTE